MARARKTTEAEPLPPSTEEQLPDGGHRNVNAKKTQIIQQYVQEKWYAIRVRQVKINNWIKDEEAYNGVTTKTLLTRSNLHLPVVFEGVQNASSKLGSAPEVSYDTIPEGDENAQDIMQHIVQEDLKDSNWRSIYAQSKVEAGIYSKSIFKVIPGNDRNRVELVDTMAYLISPIAKNTKDALYQGQQFIYKTIQQLDDEAEKMEYDTEEIAKLKADRIPSDTQTDSSTEASMKNIRLANMGLSNVTEYGSKVAELTEWITYIADDDGNAVLHHLTVANDRFLLRCKKSSELGLDRPNYIAWGQYARGISFWGAPSVADIYRDPNLAIDVNINQGIDNNTYRNFGQIMVASSSGLKQNSIVPRPLGITSVTVAPNETIQSKVYQLPVPEIRGSFDMIQTIKSFADSAAGLAPAQLKGKLSVTMQAKLNADVEAKIDDMRENATMACEELYQMMADLTKKNLTSPRKVKIFGYKTLTIEDVTKKNFEDVDFIAHALPAEDSEQNKAIKQKAKLELYTLFKDDPMIPGQIAMRRSVAKTFDIEPTEIESWFTEEEKNPSAETAPASAPAAAPAAPGDQPAPTAATPLLSATASAAQAQVPNTIKP